MSARQLKAEWTAQVVARMHRYSISNRELADKCHYSETYLSQVLNGRKEFSSDSSRERTKSKILRSLGLIEADILEEIKKEGQWFEYFTKA